jgi:hypothetical protein
MVREWERMEMDGTHLDLREQRQQHCSDCAEIGCCNKYKILK